jgi:putative transposase
VEKANYPIFLLCKVMQVSKSGYYKWFNRKNKKCFCDRNIEEEIQKIHISSRGTYGRRRILSVLKKSLFSIGKKRVLAHPNSKRQQKLIERLCIAQI